MPIEVTYPGVYIEELPSDTHRIIPADTTLAAFIGRAPIGPTDMPVKIFNYGDFTRIFGGLNADCPLSYAVQDFFANGGSQAVIARLFEPQDEKGDGFARLAFPAAPPGPAEAERDREPGGVASSLILRAANPGEWGNRLEAQADRKGIDEATARAFREEFGLDAADLFNLTLTRLDAEGGTLRTERYLNLSVRATGDAARFPNRIDRVLQEGSELARVDLLPDSPPGDGAAAQDGGGNGGRYLGTATYLGDRESKTGLYLLDHEPFFNLLCIPPDRRILSDVPEAEQDLDATVRQAAARYCADRRAFYIVDPPVAWADKAQAGLLAQIDPQELGIGGRNEAGIEVGRNAAVYFPRVWKEDVLMGSRRALFAPSGLVAGVIAATDVARGVWKAPAGQEAGLAGVLDFEVRLTDDETGQLNPIGINCLRKFPTVGPVVWGARTLRGADALEDDYKYVPVRRLALFIEESLYRGTQWAVFEPNDEALWSALRLSVGFFLADLERQGAFYGYRVACDATTTTATDVDNGVVNILVQLAPVKPAEFLVILIQQMAARGSG
jgi:phage tail sheath protein FI